MFVFFFLTRHHTNSQYTSCIFLNTSVRVMSFVFPVFEFHPELVLLCFLFPPLVCLLGGYSFFD